MKKSVIIIFIVLVSFVLIGLGCFGYFKSQLVAVGDDKTPISFEVTTGSTFSSLADDLKAKKLIRSDFVYEIYVKLKKPAGLKVGTYQLNQTMNVDDILSVLSKGNSFNPDLVNVTFREGLNMRQIADIIAQNTSNKADDVFALLKDTSYLNELIKNYWFITDSIKNSKLYYPLEGYLFPDTYQFSKNSTVKDIFKVMLNQMDKELTKYKSDIQKSKYSVHQLLTLASIIELEAGSSHERSGVAGVFYNRLNDGWTLGSDVTTYYAAKKSFKEELTYSDLKECNSYNTRSTCLVGLPVGPISNSGRESLEGVIKPSTHNYYYFVADKTGKTYFNSSLSGHNQTIANLKSAGLWYEYQ